MRIVMIDAAKALRMDQLVGSLEIGKWADIIVVEIYRVHLVSSEFVSLQLASCANHSTKPLSLMTEI